MWNNINIINKAIKTCDGDLLLMTKTQQNLKSVEDSEAPAVESMNSDRDRMSAATQNKNKRNNVP